MNINCYTNISSKRTLKDDCSYRGIFKNASEAIELKDGIFHIHLKFAKTNCTASDMWIQIRVDFNELLKSCKNPDIEDFKAYAYIKRDIKVHMSEEQHKKLTGGNSNYLLPIYKSIISEALDYFFDM